ncbi:hypothetical protein C8R47DRAFT_1329829, partial [Mycena vitilis]
MQRSTSHIHGSISLPTSPKLLSDPYKYDYFRRRTKSTRSSTVCPDAASPPSAKRLERLVSELENIRLSEVRAPSKASLHSQPSLSRSSGQPSLSHPSTSRSSVPSKSTSSSVQSTPPRIRKRKSRYQSSQKPHSTARCPHGFRRFIASPRDFKRCVPGFKHACPHVNAQARCPHCFKRSLSPGSFKRSHHSFKPVCPHGYSQAACDI